MLKRELIEDGSKQKKKEKFGNSVGGAQYASYNTSQETKTHQEIEKDRQTFSDMNNKEEKTQRS